jgi:hypothetical protein
MAVHTMQVTIGAAVTQISAVSVPVQQVMFQNNQTHSMRIGDFATSSTRGALLASGAPGGTMNVGALTFNKVDLMQFWVVGTQNDVVDVIYID